MKRRLAGLMMMLSAVVTQSASADPTTAPSDTTTKQDKVPVALTVHIENDARALKWFDAHDRHYTSGLKLVFAAAPEWSDEPLQWLNSIDFLQPWNDGFEPGRTALGIVAGQNFYTPKTIEVEPVKGDRPYAGWLYGGGFWQRGGDPDEQGRSTVLDHFEFNLGIVGPSSLAEDTQKWFHERTGDPQPVGWDTQIHDEIAFDFIYRRKWNVPLFRDGNFEGQFIPQAGFTLGTLHRQAEAALQVRIGWDLPDDFGVGRIDDVRAYTNLRSEKNSSFYFFGRVDGRAVEHNLFIEGNTWRKSTLTAEAEPLVGLASFGFAAQLGEHVEITYAQTYLTHEYENQPGADGYGAVAITFNWNF
jgi:lipid A 3-O-deacylase